MATTPTLVTPEIHLVDGQAVTDSIAISQIFNKQHKNVLQKIENLECSAEFRELNFKPVKYQDSKGEFRPSYNITRDGFTFLAMSFTGKRAAQFKEAYIAAFNQMEQQLVDQPVKALRQYQRFLMTIENDQVKPLIPIDEDSFMTTLDDLPEVLCERMSIDSQTLQKIAEVCLKKLASRARGV